MICAYCGSQRDSLPWPNTCSKCLIERLPELNHDHRLDKVKVVMAWMKSDADGQAWMATALTEAGWIVMPPSIAGQMREVQQRTKRMAEEAEEVRRRLADG